MPKVHCAHCGEELLGSVNRCWKCGRAFVAEHNPDNLPPVRRRPIPLELVNRTREELLAPKAEPAAVAVTAASGGEGQAAIEAVIVGGESSESAGASTDQTTPTAASAPTRPATQSAPYYTTPPQPAYPVNAGATGGAIAALVLGVMSLLAIRFIAPGALLVAILGVAMGVWGLHSDRRGAALVGLVLCCLAMALAGFFTAVQLFELINGYNPLEPDLPPIEPDAF
ncbi:MAG: hypothetical protein KY475_10880 [Planctomycetes bacterium]|nr:hypothetical protein [Planctomycetota bacterium]